MTGRQEVSDRRRFVRVEEELPFAIGHRGYEIQAKSVNISTHGVMCRVDRDIPLMAKLEMVFSLPIVVKFSTKDKVVKAKGVVVRKEKEAAGDKYFIAVYFSDIKPKDQKILNEFIEYRIKK